MFVGLQKASRTPHKERGSRRLLALVGRRPCFSSLEQNRWLRKSQSQVVPFATASQQWIWLTSWLSSVLRCCARAQENSSMAGSDVLKPARSANAKAVFWVVNQSKRLARLA